MIKRLALILVVLPLLYGAGQPFGYRIGAFGTDSTGDIPGPPTFSSGAVAEATPHTVDLTFSDNMAAPSGTTGITIEAQSAVDSSWVSLTLSSAALKGGDATTVQVTLTNGWRPFDGQAVRWSYVSGSGNLQASVGGTEVDTLINASVTNNTSTSPANLTGVTVTPGNGEVTASGYSEPATYGESGDFRVKPDHWDDAWAHNEENIADLSNYVPAGLRNDQDYVVQYRARSLSQAVSSWASASSVLPSLHAYLASLLTGDDAFGYMFMVETMVFNSADCSTTPITNGAEIGCVKDFSANANNATSSGVTNTPEWETANGVLWDGKTVTDEALNIATNPTLEGDYTVAWIETRNNQAQNPRIMGAEFRWQAGTTFRLIGGAATADITTSRAAGAGGSTTEYYANVYILTHDNATTTSTLYHQRIGAAPNTLVDSTLLNVGSTTTDPGILTLDELGNIPVSGQALQGHTPVIMAFESVADGTTRQAMADAMALIWLANVPERQGARTLQAHLDPGEKVKKPPTTADVISFEQSGYGQISNPEFWGSPQTASCIYSFIYTAGSGAALGPLDTNVEGVCAAGSFRWFLDITPRYDRTQNRFGFASFGTTADLRKHIGTMHPGYVLYGARSTLTSSVGTGDTTIPVSGDPCGANTECALVRKTTSGCPYSQTECPDWSHVEWFTTDNDGSKYTGVTRSPTGGFSTASGNAALSFVSGDYVLRPAGLWGGGGTIAMNVSLTSPTDSSGKTFSEQLAYMNCTQGGRYADTSGTSYPDLANIFGGFYYDVDHFWHEGDGDCDNDGSASGKCAVTGGVPINGWAEGYNYWGYGQHAEYTEFTNLCDSGNYILTLGNRGSWDFQPGNADAANLYNGVQYESLAEELDSSQRATNPQGYYRFADQTMQALNMFNQMRARNPGTTQPLEKRRDVTYPGDQNQQQKKDLVIRVQSATNTGSGTTLTASLDCTSAGIQVNDTVVNLASTSFRNSNGRHALISTLTTCNGTTLSATLNTSIFSATNQLFGVHNGIRIGDGGVNDNDLVSGYVANVGNRHTRASYAASLVMGLQHWARMNSDGSGTYGDAEHRARGYDWGYVYVGQSTMAGCGYTYGQATDQNNYSTSGSPSPLRCTQLARGWIGEPVSLWQEYGRWKNSESLDLESAAGDPIGRWTFDSTIESWTESGAATGIGWVTDGGAGALQVSLTGNYDSNRFCCNIQSPDITISNGNYYLVALRARLGKTGSGRMLIIGFDAGRDEQSQENVAIHDEYRWVVALLKATASSSTANILIDTGKFEYPINIDEAVIYDLGSSIEWGVHHREYDFGLAVTNFTPAGRLVNLVDLTGQCWQAPQHHEGTAQSIQRYDPDGWMQGQRVCEIWMPQDSGFTFVRPQ